MIANITNQNFGYSTACDSVWAAVGNPDPFRYNFSSASIICTGSVEIYEYNINTDTHIPKTFLYRPITPTEIVLLTTENNNTNTLPSASGPFWYIQTEYTGSIPYTANMDLRIDYGNFINLEDGYGWALDMRDTILAVGNPYFTSQFGVGNIVFTGSGYVDLYDLSTLDIDPYLERTPPIITNTGSLNGYVTATIYVPPAQNYTSILFQIINSSIGSNWITVNQSQTSNSGGTITLNTGQTILQYNQLSNVRVVGVVGTIPYLTTLYNPDPIITSSFGYSVSLNDEWLAVGSPQESSSRGSVFMFRKINNNNLSWSFYQSLNLPSNISSGDNFGSSVALNKASSSYSWSMVVGSSKLSSSRAYVYNFNGTNWINNTTLFPDNTTVYPLTFYPTNPIIQNYPNINDSFGKAVSMYGDTVMIGAPTDRVVQENLSSSFYPQGAVYFFETCNSGNTNGPFYLVLKSYGNENILKDNMLGWSVNVYDNYAIAGSPKTNALSSSICYLRGSLFQDHFCGDNTDETLCGQFVLYNLITGSLESNIINNDIIDWNITNVYQVKKQFLSPYRVYGWSTSLSEQFILIGAPMLISGSNTIMDFDPTVGSFTGSVYNLDDLTGKAYIYNLNNLRFNFYVGNVFYRNGKVVIMTSGSAYEGLQFNTDVNNNEYQYNINFTSKQTIYEKQIVCPVEPGEFNVSTNPTSLVLPIAEFDINENGQFDFQDVDILLHYMAYKNTETNGIPNTNWSSSIIDTTTDEEQSVYNMYSSQWNNTTNYLFTSSFSYIDNNLYNDLDLNNDNKLNSNDMFILWKYFIHRLNQKNYNTYITPNSKNRFLSDILNYINSKTLRGQLPQINQNFLDAPALSIQDMTGSYLYPTATSIGLYSGTQLVCISKLGAPIKITPNFTINFIVKIDF